MAPKEQGQGNKEEGSGRVINKIMKGQQHAGRKGRRLNVWREEKMRGAIEEYQKQVEMGKHPQLRFLARAWCVPKSTLQRRVKGLVRGFCHASGKNPLLSAEAEKELADLIRLLAGRGFPMTRNDVQNLAFQYAKANGLKGFSEGKQKAGYYWFHGFMKRNKNLSIRKPEALSAARASGMNPTVVSRWFNEYERLLTELQIKDVPSHIWNCDESGLQDHFISKRVVAEAGKPCFEITGGEKGETVTVLAGFNAVGTFSPVMVIFKGKRVRAEWVCGSPNRAIIRVSENGWINSQLFLEWGQQFVAQLPKEDCRPHVLLLDGHYSHVFNLEFLQLMKHNNVHVVSYPPHTTHALQPADKSLFKSLKNNWQEMGRKWTRTSGGKKLPKHLFFSMFTPAWEKTATTENAQSGFRATGMFPLNEDAIPCEVFTPSLTTEREEQAVTPEMAECNGTNCPQEVLIMEEGMGIVGEVVLASQPESDHQNDLPSTSGARMGQVMFCDLVSIPTRERGKRKLARLPSYNLTSEEHFDHIKKSKSKKGKKGKDNGVSQSVVKKMAGDSLDSCTVCRKLYGHVTDPKSNEDWVACVHCGKWFHETCGEENGLLDENEFICKDCVLGI